MNRIKKGSIIGGGVSGLAAGVLLAKEGLKVSLFEANEKGGGSCATSVVDGYLFNDGTSGVPSNRMLGGQHSATTQPNSMRSELMAAIDDLNSQRFYHGTKADVKPGDLIEPGYNSNYGQRKKAAYVYLTATLDAAIWGAELALGEGPGRIYMVEPTGPIEDDPNLTDKKYPGNPTKSYRSRDPLRVTGEITDWQGHSPEELKAMKDHLERLRRLGIEAIED